MKKFREKLVGRTDGQSQHKYELIRPLLLMGPVKQILGNTLTLDLC